MNKKLTNRLLAVLLSLVMALALLPTGLFSLPAYAAYSGTGAPGDPYIVTSYADLKALMEPVNAGNVFIDLGASIVQEDNLNEMNIEIEGSSMIVLDLNGYSLSRETRSVDKNLFSVSEMSTLYIRDSSESQGGTISYANDDHDKTMFLNQGSLVIEGGTFINAGGLSSIILNVATGGVNIRGGVFRGGTDTIVAYSTLPLERSAMTHNYPFVAITGGEFYSDSERNIDCLVPTFIGGGTFYNTKSDGNFAWLNDNDKCALLVYCGGTFRTDNQNFTPATLIKHDNTFQKTKMIGGLQYYENISPIVITDGSVDVHTHLLEKCVLKFGQFFKGDGAKPVSPEVIASRYPALFDTSVVLDGWETIKRYELRAPTLSIQHPKTEDCEITWSQSTDGENYTDITGTENKQTITPPDPAASGTVYYNCEYKYLPTGESVDDTIIVEYSETQPTSIESVSITGIAQPVADRTPDFTAVDTDKYTVDEIRWIDLTAQKYLADDENCIGNHSYRCCLTLSAKNGYKFDSIPEVTIPSFGSNPDILNSNGVLEVSFDVWVDYSYVKDFNLRGVTPPVEGQHPDLTAKAVGNKITATDVEWCEYFGDFRVLTADDAFEAGKQYQCTARFEGNEEAGYRLDNSGFTATLNGEALEYVDIHHISGQNTCALAKVFTAASFPFEDVPVDAYYKTAVAWAVANGITAGTSATTFSPENTCTRAQAVSFLWRASGSPAPETTTMPFSDVPTGAYYYKAVLWAVEQGVVAGTSATTFSPDTNCTRAQIVTMLWRMERPEATAVSNPFTDLADGAYYVVPVLWAVGADITAGTSATTFSPEDNCTRAQIVTFIYRDME